VPADKLFTQERGAAQLLNIIAGARLPEHNGAYLAWDGSSIVW
jgi:hypothetical protein